MNLQEEKNTILDEGQDGVKDVEIILLLSKNTNFFCVGDVSERLPYH